MKKVVGAHLDVFRGAKNSIQKLYVFIQSSIVKYCEIVAEPAFQQKRQRFLKMIKETQYFSNDINENLDMFANIVYIYMFANIVCIYRH